MVQIDTKHLSKIYRSANQTHRSWIQLQCGPAVPSLVLDREELHHRCQPPKGRSSPHNGYFSAARCVLIRDSSSVKRARFSMEGEIWLSVEWMFILYFLRAAESWLPHGSCIGFVCSAIRSSNPLFRTYRISTSNENSPTKGARPWRVSCVTYALGYVSFRNNTLSSSSCLHLF